MTDISTTIYRPNARGLLQEVDPALTATAPDHGDHAEAMLVQVHVGGQHISGVFRSADGTVHEKLLDAHGRFVTPGNETP